MLKYWFTFINFPKGKVFILQTFIFQCTFPLFQFCFISIFIPLTYRYASDKHLHNVYFVLRFWDIDRDKKLSWVLTCYWCKWSDAQIHSNNNKMSSPVIIEREDCRRHENRIIIFAQRIKDVLHREVAIWVRDERTKKIFAFWENMKRTFRKEEIIRKSERMKRENVFKDRLINAGSAYIDNKGRSIYGSKLLPPSLLH